MCIRDSYDAVMELDTGQSPNEFQVVKLVGHGAFGKVQRVRHKTSNETSMWKEVPYFGAEAKERACRKQLVLEVHILRNFSHPNIVGFQGCIVNTKAQIVYILMEDCEGGDLADVIKSWKGIGRPPQEDLIWKILADLAVALQVCHCAIEGQPVIHRDIKPSNILFSKERRAKLGDFGLACVYGTPPLFEAKNPIGTPYYMPPEQVRFRKSYPASDIWSLGCVLFEVCSFKRPFDAPSIEGLHALITSGNKPSLPPIFSQELSDIIMGMLEQRPEDRTTTQDLLCNPRIDALLDDGLVEEAKAMFARTQAYIDRIAQEERAEEQAQKEKEQAMIDALIQAEEAEAQWEVEAAEEAERDRQREIEEAERDRQREIEEAEAEEHRRANRATAEAKARAREEEERLQAERDEQDEVQRRERELDRREAALLAKERMRGAPSLFPRDDLAARRTVSHYKSPSQHLRERRSISPLRSPYMPHDAEPIPFLNGLLLAQNMDLDQVLGMVHKIEAHTRRVKSMVESGHMRDVKLNFGDCGFYLG
eukprot:TRINITY_DN15554_c0_g1_i4.p1 TRINITY_DN15554_c0_g1~~TRINITY_DN15554_c0_g1_i4.p1  ORF type:complete len:537 (-),score=167.96 TRINITY_DN15554_c0_g1_i4:230-1840(-)